MSVRALRVFVSSTFQDMHAERDVLTRVAFPALRERFRTRGVAISEVDLRWGITRQDAAEANVLPICLAEIERCRPFFIALIGDRYGWVDPRAGRLLQDQPHLRDYADRSITELEVRHAALQAPGAASSGLFYFRSPRDPAASVEGAALARLEADIRSRHPSTCRDYASVQDLSRQVESDLAALVEASLSRAGLGESVERARAEVAATLLPGAVERPGVLREIERRLDTPGARVALVGPRGSGKSTVLAMLAARPAAARRFPSMGFAKPAARRWIASPSSALGRALDWRTAVAELCHAMGSDADASRDPSGESLLGAARQLAGDAAAQGRVVLCLDGLDALQPAVDTELSWVGALLHPRVSVVAACASPELARRLEAMGFDLLALPPWREADAAQAVERYLATYGKKLDEPLARRLASTASDPATLRMQLDELRLFGSFESLEDEVAVVAGLRDAAAVAGKILGRVRNDPALEGAHACDLVLHAVAAARGGVTDHELRELCALHGTPLTPRALAELTRALEPLVACRAGAWHPRSSQARAAILAAAGTDGGAGLVRLFLHEPPGPRSVEELPGLLAAAGRWDELVRWLATPEAMQCLDERLPQDLPLIAQACDAHRGDAFRAALAAASLRASGPALRAMLGVLGQVAPRQALACIDGRLPQLQPTDAASLALVAADVHARLGDADEALRRLDAVEVAGLPEALGRELRARRASCALDAGDLERAAADIAALRAAAATDFATQRALGNLEGALLLKRGLWSEAALHFERQRERADRQGDYGSLQAALGNLAVVARLQRRPRAALELHAREEKVCRMLGDWASLLASLGNQALCAIELGRFEDALRLLDGKAALAAERRALVPQIEAYMAQALALSRAGQPAVARNLLDRAMDMAGAASADRMQRDIRELAARIA